MAAEDYIDIYDMPDDKYQGYDEHVLDWGIRRDIPMRVERKYYCGAAQILTNDWARKTEAEAIEHARQILASEPEKSHVAIVKIIKIVRRRPPTKPEIIVEDVK